MLKLNHIQVHKRNVNVYSLFEIIAAKWAVVVFKMNIGIIGHVKTLAMNVSSA